MGDKNNLPRGLDTDNPAVGPLVEPHPLTGVPAGDTWAPEQLEALGHQADLAHVVVGGTTYEVRGKDWYWPGTDILCATNGLFVE